jgi:hypothetical protein
VHRHAMGSVRPCHIPGALIAFRVAFGGFKISDCGAPLACLGNGQRHVQHGIFEVFPRFLVEKCLRDSGGIQGDFSSVQTILASRAAAKRGEGWW